MLTGNYLRKAAALLCPSFVTIGDYHFLDEPLGSPEAAKHYLNQTGAHKRSCAETINSFNWIDLTDYIEIGPGVSERGAELQIIVVNSWKAHVAFAGLANEIDVRPLSPNETGDWYGVAAEVILGR